MKRPSSKKAASKKRAASKQAGRKSAAKRPATGSRLHSPAPEPVRVTYVSAPPPFKRRENIHPRRVLPRVLEGKEREFHSVTPQMMLQPLARAFAPQQAAADDLTLVTNTELLQPGLQQLASNVGEPSVAMNGDVVLYTGNWYAARSIDGGQDVPVPRSLHRVSGPAQSRLLLRPGRQLHRRRSIPSCGCCSTARRPARRPTTSSASPSPRPPRS